jgi:hypothetical protein
LGSAGGFCSASIKGARSACVPPGWRFASMRDTASQCFGSAAKVGIVSSNAAVSPSARISGVSRLAHGISKSISCRWARTVVTQGLRPDGDFRRAVPPHSSDQARAQIRSASAICVISARRRQCPPALMERLEG